MSGVLGAVRAASVTEIEVDSLHYRVRRVSSADLARVGFAWLSMATPDDGSNTTDATERVKAG